MKREPDEQQPETDEGDRGEHLQQGEEHESDDGE